MGKKLKRSWFC